MTKYGKKYQQQLNENRVPPIENARKTVLPKAATVLDWFEYFGVKMTDELHLSEKFPKDIGGEKIIYYTVSDDLALRLISEKGIIYTILVPNGDVVKSELLSPTNF